MTEAPQWFLRCSNSVAAAAAGTSKAWTVLWIGGIDLLLGQTRKKKKKQQQQQEKV